jgi:hypothetical protein
MNQAPKRRGRPPKSMLKSIDTVIAEMDTALDNQAKSILEEAHEVIYGDRESTYGDPGKNLRTIASMWSAYLDKELTYQDVCNMMVLMKVSRLKNTPNHRDSLVDIAGYTALQDRVNRA